MLRTSFHFRLRPSSSLRFISQSPSIPKSLPFSRTYADWQRVWPYLYSPRKTMPPQLDSYFKQVDDLADSFIDRLRKAVAIPSVSAEDERRPDVVKVS